MWVLFVKLVSLKQNEDVPTQRNCIQYSNYLCVRRYNFLPVCYKLMRIWNEEDEE